MEEKNPKIKVWIHMCINQEEYMMEKRKSFQNDINPMFLLSGLWNSKWAFV